MSLQHTLRRWTQRPLILKIASAAHAPSSTIRLPTHRPVSLAPYAQRQLLQRQTPLKSIQQSQLQNTFRARRAFHSSRFRSNKSSGYTYQSPNSAPSLSQRLKTLSREYGWSALWIYLFLSALDFPFCFAAVKLLGADKIGHYEHVVVESFKGSVNKVWPGAFEESKEEEEGQESETQAIEKKKGPAEGASMFMSFLSSLTIDRVVLIYGTNYSRC